MGEAKTEVIPLGRQILVRPDAAPALPAGLARPDSAPEERSRSGIVVRLPAGEHFYQVGWRVYFAPWAGTEIKIDGERHFLLDGGDWSGKGGELLAYDPEASDAGA